LNVPGSISALPARTLQFITARDHNVMRQIHRWRPPRWIRALMVGASRTGDGGLWLGLGLLLLLSGDPRRYEAVSAAGLAAAVGIGLYLILKRATGRKRPCMIEPHCWAQMLPPDHYSFPSGHTLTAFAIATSVSVVYPQLAIVLFSCAALIAISRVVLGMHFVSDVVAGALMGTALGFLMVFLVQAI
jgi:undecaprenyl-diphosphatase